MKINRSISSLVAAAGVAIAALGMTGTAQADNVYWSVGVSSPGVNVGVANGPPMYQPVYQQPVYVEPRPMYRRAPPQVVYVQPAPVYVAQPQYVQSGWGYPDRGWRHGHGRRQDFDRYDGGRSGHGRRD
ncbi:hypothetical protein [Rhodoferax ferrireducens]|uniref:hypothetical protein n=1 Tax=Rhodoferax ferrireducens TaxID=192843 RepID=UPI000E0DF9CA|nr:hypothetical protein [Rhodoferax ferrireducens]